MKVEGWQLKQRQSNPLEVKIQMSNKRIRDWYDHWDGEVYISFSGGKDSTALLHLVREIYPRVPAIFVDTGLEYPEIREFVKTVDNVTWLKPKLLFNKVIEKYGYPVVSKETARKLRDLQNPTPKNKRTIDVRMGLTSNKVGICPIKWRYLKDAPFKISDTCCDVLKKRPIKLYEKETGRKSIVGLMATESRYRTQQYMRNGCNSFETKRPMSTPIMFWLEEDIWEYLKRYHVSYSKIYDKGYTRTGCMFCMFGVHLEKGKNRFQRMKETHPSQYKYCIEKLGCGKVLDYIKVEY